MCLDSGGREGRSDTLLNPVSGFLSVEFAGRVSSLVKKKGPLCVAIDPAVPGQRTTMTADKNRVRFCVGMIKKVSPHCPAVKFNQQYLFGLTHKEHLAITKTAKKFGLLSILDYKLCDIGDSVDSAIFHISRCGYDAFTFSPFAGNLANATRTAHESGIGIIALTLMSNPEAGWIGSLFRKIAGQVKKSGADGCVVGATGHVSRSGIRDVVRLAGRERLFLVPGIGAQGGNPSRVVECFRDAGAENLLLVAGRSIIYANDPEKTAEKYCSEFSGL